MPLTDEEILGNSVEDNEALLLERKAQILKRAIDKEQKLLREKAEKWDNFEAGTLKPFSDAVQKFTPKTPKVSKRTKKLTSKGKAFVAVFNDWQIGLKAIKEFMNNQKNWGNQERQLKVLKSLQRKSRLM